MTTVYAPAVRALLPDGWRAKESVTLVAPDGYANVIASSEPVDPGLDAQQYAEAQGDLLRREFSGYQELEFGPRLIFGGRPGYVRTFSWQPENGDPVTQIQLYYAESGRGYTATATTPSSEFQRYGSGLRSCLEGPSLTT